MIAKLIASIPEGSGPSRPCGTREQKMKAIVEMIDVTCTILLCCIEPGNSNTEYRRVGKATHSYVCFSKSEDRNRFALSKKGRELKEAQAVRLHADSQILPHFFLSLRV